MHCYRSRIIDPHIATLQKLIRGILTAQELRIQKVEWKLATYVTGLEKGWLPYTQQQDTLFTIKQ